MAETFFFEKKYCHKFNTVIAVSQKDRDTFQTLYGLSNVATIPTGVDIGYFYPQEMTTEVLSLVFVGSMDWLPNEDAILYFAKKILPSLKKEIPGIRLTVVGRNPSSRLKKQLATVPEIHLTGWVDDVRPYIAKAMLYIIPIRIGGGTRMKIYEAMAMGKAILSTSIGAEGLAVKDEENILLEDDPFEFSKIIVQMAKDSKMRTRLGKNALAYVNESCSWYHAGEAFHLICCSSIVDPNIRTVS